MFTNEYDEKERKVSRKDLVLDPGLIDKVRV